MKRKKTMPPITQPPLVPLIRCTVNPPCNKPGCWFCQQWKAGKR